MATGLAVRFSTITRRTLRQPLSRHGRWPPSARSPVRRASRRRRNHQHRFGVLDAILERHGRKRRTPPNESRRCGCRRASRSGSRAPAHIDDDAVAAPHTLCLERVGEAAHLGMQLAVAQAPHVAGLASKMTAVLWPRSFRCTSRQLKEAFRRPSLNSDSSEPRVVQRHREGVCQRAPGCEIRPESDMVVARALAQISRSAGLMRARAAKAGGGESCASPGEPIGCSCSPWIAPEKALGLRGAA